MDDEGLTTFAIDEDCKFLVVGGSFGHIRIIDLNEILGDLKNLDSQGQLTVLGSWRAHTGPISSISYVKMYDIILSASKDACVRLWTMSGMLY